MRGSHFYRICYLMLLATLMSCSEGEKYSLSPHDFVDALQRNPGQLIDVRSAREWQEQHLSDALNFTMQDQEAFKRAINRLSRQKVYYLYCQNGESSAAALRSMRESGFTQVYDLRGGLSSLQQEGYSVAGL